MSFWRRLFGRKEPPTVQPVAPAPAPPSTDSYGHLAESWIDAAPNAEALTAQPFLNALEALSAQGRQIKVIGLLRRALVRFPEHVPTLMRLATLAVERRELNVAKPALETITRSGAQEERIRAHFLLGELAEGEGQKEEARVHYEAILALDFHYPLARERALRLAEEQGRAGGAYAHATMTQGVSGGSLGSFSLQRELGRGAAGAVYLATDTQLGRQVALKILHPHLASKEEERQRFFAEASAASSFRHPGVVRIYDVDESIFGIVMEHLSGGTLKERIAAGLSAKHAVALCQEIAQILEFIHVQGIVHRDLKPANLLFRAAGPEGGAGRLVLTDFGVAHLTQTEEEKKGGVVGTLAYMAPEQLRGEEATPSADLYALGVILYECLAQRPPFSPEEIARGETTLSLAPALARVSPGAHAKMGALLSSLLAPSPSARPESAREAEVELRKLLALFELGEDGVAAFSDAIAVAKTQITMRPEARKALVRAAFALGLSQEEAARFAREGGLSTQEAAIFAAELNSEMQKQSGG